MFLFMNRLTLLIFSLITVLTISSSSCQSPVSTDTSVSLEQLIHHEFLKGGIEIKNISFAGSRQSLGLFSYQSNLFPLSSGIILSTGKASAISGPNHSIKTSGVFHSPGDTALDLISRGWTEDACVIEFDFVPSSENIAFDFVFGSEEYLEYVNSVFNDVFAFIVTNTVTKEKFNIARLPQTGEPITVNNVNHLKNQGYFIDNPAPNILLLMEKEDEINGKNNRKKQQEIDQYNQSLIKCKTKLCEEIQYDGFTKVITARAKVIPEQMYHFKIAIADVGDAQYDSGVILKSHSFKSFDNYGRIKGDTTGEIVVLPGVTTIPPKEKAPITLPNQEESLTNIYFDFDSDELKKESVRTLDSLSLYLQKFPDRNIKISGHTDWKGSDRYNEKLSYRRTLAAKRKLVSSGIKEERIQLDYKGEKFPAADNAEEEGRRINRRVEIMLSH